jgi:hypothetical protein
MRYPKTLIEFMQLYPTEAECREAIFEHRWRTHSRALVAVTSVLGSSRAATCMSAPAATTRAR